ncbi:DUF58 domain-containing protein [Veronia nyctiphanis]|uniref:DUF58 domain-containing protein n=1 Tax=Veronia nyctiphanis TaxID=1278244 RepID=A0A4Q0YQ78_9GAMM|nr:DUF58 domain-containing protein [Veronia nyctiphanis]RXJ73250.1 DUF58 domain-containing protein [Veronia nyctiphanis]
MTQEQQLPRYSDGVTLSLPEMLQYKSQTIRWLPPAKSVWSQMSGQHRSSAKGRGMNFAEVRLYQAGDDIRAIDWRVTARTGKAHTKLFSEEREQPVMLMVDLSASMQFGSKLLLKSVQAAHFASLLSWIAVGEKDRVGTVISNGLSLRDCKPTARQQGPLNVINTLIEAQQEVQQEHREQHEKHTFSKALQHLHHLCPKGSEIVIISDFQSLNDNDRLTLSRMRQHNRIQFVRISDPLERGQTDFRGTEQVSDRKQSAWLDFSSARTRSRFSLHFQQHQDFIKDMARALAIPVHSLSAAEPLLAQLTSGLSNKVATTQTRGKPM